MKRKMNYIKLKKSIKKLSSINWGIDTEKLEKEVKELREKRTAEVIPKFIVPQLIKAGSDLLGLGILKRPPRVDCRVIAEEGYQQLIQVYNKYKHVEDERVLLLGSFEDSVGEYIKEQENHEVKRTLREITRIKATAFWCLKFARKLSF